MAAPGLWLVPAGVLPPGGIASRERLAASLALWRERYSWIVLDMPPVGEAGAALGWLNLLDGMVVVIAAERTTWDQAANARAACERAQVPLLGAVLNRRP